MNARKINKTAKTFLGVFSAMIVLMLAGIVLVAVEAVSNRPSEIAVAAGSIVYNNANAAIELGSEGVIAQEISSGQYYLSPSDGGKIPLGTNTVVYSSAGMQIIGGGYYVDEDGMVESVQDEYIYAHAQGSALIKLADRKYLLIGPEIADEDAVFTTQEYLYIVLDTVGNAYLISNTMSLKTTSPTTVVSGDISFDIAQELLSLESQVIDMQTVMGSTNTYDSAINKALDDEQTPDVIEVSIQGGDGGDGGLGGVGGTGGDGGNGGEGGKGGEGGEGGEGGVGGSGGTGGSGGSGGTAGLAEDADAVTVLQLNSASSNTSASITVNFSFIDYYGALGLVYLELHEVSELSASNLTVAELYDGAEGASDYWSTYDEDPLRASIHTYETSYTFTQLKSDTLYYVVLAHYYEVDDTTVTALVDYYKISTIAQKNILQVTTLSANSVSVLFSIEDVNLCSDYDAYVLRLSLASTSEHSADDATLDIKLSADDIRLAALSSYTVTFDFTSNEFIQYSTNYYATEKLSVMLIDEAAEGDAVLTSATKNTFYGYTS